jgi:diguanylate cyclase (GGDEF)-like protein/PAS domain S-box-containing protein
MNFDIPTLAFVSCVAFLCDFIALFVQYIVNRAYRGVRWWLMGSALWALGVIFIPMVSIKSLLILAMIANPLIVVGQIFFYIGIVRFLGSIENKKYLAAIFTVFMLFYYYFMFAHNEISGRSLALTVTQAVISFITAFEFYIHKDRRISASANFTAFVFFSYGCFIVVRIFWIVFSPPIIAYSDQGQILSISFIVPIITSFLWTFGFIIMMNQRLNAENREEKDKLQLIFNTSPDAAVISRLTDGTIVDVNAGFLGMSGYTRAELIENTTLKINIWRQLADRERFIKALKEHGNCENMEFIFQRKDGSLLTGSLSARIILIQKVPHIVSVTHDITQSKQSEEAMRESEALYRSIINASPDDITITDMRGCVLMISPAARKMFGYEPDYDRFIGSQLVDYIVPEDRERAKANILRTCIGDYAGPNEYHGIRKDGSIFDIEVNSGLILDSNRQPAKMVFIVRDITERKQTEQQIQNLVQQLELEKKTAQLNANTDSLTGLANRRYFDEALNTEFYRLKRSGLPLSLIMLDVDYFKKFNDTYGHLAGDDCLRQIGTMLKTVVHRTTDVVARYGGDEFVAVLVETDPHGASALAERIRKAVDLLAIPHAGSGLGKYVTVSLGVVTVYPSHLASTDQVVALADEALYSAKQDGRNRTSVRTSPAILDRYLVG